MGCIIPSLYIAYTDYRCYIVKHIVTMPMIAGGVIYSFFFADLKASLLGTVIVFLIMAFLAVKGGVGGGDVWYSAALGAWFGIPAVWYVLLLGSLLAVIINLAGHFKKGVLKNKLNELKSKFILLFIFKDFKKAGFKELPEEDEADANLQEDIVPYGFYLALGTLLVFAFKVVVMVENFNLFF